MYERSCYYQFVARAPSPTRSRILTSGTNLLSTAGLAGITLGTLAEQTGMSKSGLFAPFGSKEEVQLGLLEHTAEIAGTHVVSPAMRAAEGLPRLSALIKNWLGWTTRAGLAGGCPIAAGIFELDDSDGPLRDRLLQIEEAWRGLIAQQVACAIELGHLRRDLDIEQFVWELCGIYLSHHASVRFVRDARANQRAQTALNALLARALPKTAKKAARR